MLDGARVFSDPRFDGDEHLQCPVHTQGSRWLDEIVRAWVWTHEGAPLGDFEPAPSAALIEGVELMRSEARALRTEVDRIEDARRGRAQ